MKKIIVIMLSLVFCNFANANSLTASIGLDVEKSSRKTLQFGYSYIPIKNPTYHFFSLEGVVGFYQADEFLKNGFDSLMAEVGFGLETSPSWVYFKVEQFISFSTSGMLYEPKGTTIERRWIQLPTKLSLGMTDKKFRLGVFLKHYSDGTVSALNGRGVNFYGVDLGWKL